MQGEVQFPAPAASVPAYFKRPNYSLLSIKSTLQILQDRRQQDG